MEYDRQFSLHVSSALNCLGKSHNMVKFRVNQYKEEERLSTIMCPEMFYPIIAGSKSEGLTARYESDRDIMYVMNDVMCADNTAQFRNANGITVYEAERRSTPPGYTLLRLDKFGKPRFRKITKLCSFKDCSGKLYLSSDIYLQCVRPILTDGLKPFVNFNRNGPSQSYSLDGLNDIGPAGLFINAKQDSVQAFHYSCPEIIQSFITRPRYHEWPTNGQLEELSNLEGHVVPVGYKGSQTAFLEWRICYTKSERFLMQSLNDTQAKTYILLKMVSKTYINFVCKEITSYVLKNLVLWLAEWFNLDHFQEEFLVDRLIQALIFLRNCVKYNHLPCYMIPERNLFSGKLELAQRQKIVFLLNELIDEGGGLLMGCERLRGAMLVLYKEPAKAEQYKCNREQIEQLDLWQYNILLARRASGVSSELLFADENLINILNRLENTIMPDRQSLMLEGHNEWSIICIFKERVTQWLS